MCRAVKCNRCHKMTWAGCGAHVEQVLGHLPMSERCQCSSKEKEQSKKSPLEYLWPFKKSPVK